MSCAWLACVVCWFGFLCTERMHRACTAVVEALAISYFKHLTIYDCVSWESILGSSTSEYDQLDQQMAERGFLTEDVCTTILLAVYGCGFFFSVVCLLLHSLSLLQSVASGCFCLGRTAAKISLSARPGACNYCAWRGCACLGCILPHAHIIGVGCASFSNNALGHI